MMAPFAPRKWSAMFLGMANPVTPEADSGPVSGDAWTEACMNDPSWWIGLQNVAGNILIS
jgi:hypothetical protein